MKQKLITVLVALLKEVALMLLEEIKEALEKEKEVKNEKVS